MGKRFAMGLDNTKARLTLAVGALTGLFACLILATAPASAQTISFASSARNCDNNAVIDCGALSVAELQQKFNATPSVRTIYTAFNISPQDITNMSTDIACNVSTSVSTTGTMLCSGTVTKSGLVMVGSQTVASHALTAGRQNIAGSHPLDMDGVTFFERAPSISFVSDNLDAFVVMQGGQFQFAILASCGNPVSATPATKPVPKPVAQTMTPTPPVVQQQQQQQQVVIVQQPVQTVVEQVQAPQPQSLPSTGPGSYIGLFAGASILGTIAARLFLKRRAASSMFDTL